MKKYFLRTLQEALLVWIALAAGITITATLYAILNAAQVPESTSLLVAFITLVGLIVGWLLVPRSFLSLREETKASMLKWPFQIWTLLEHVKQKRSQQGYMQQQYAPPMYPPQGVNVTGVNNASTKNDTPLIIEVILSLFGIYGIGWLMAGETTTGVILLICSFAVYWPLLILIAMFTLGLGLACDFPLAIAAIIINAVLLNKTLAKKTSQEVSSRSSRAKEFR